MTITIIEDTINKNTFVKLPNNLFYKKENEIKINGDIYFDDRYDDKLISILTYLSFNKNFENICGTSMEHIVLNCKMKLNKNKGKSNDKVKQSIQYLVDKNYISADIDISKAKAKDCIMFSFSDVRDDFSMLYKNDYNSIMNYKGDKISNTKLLTLFAYINQSIHKPEKGSCGLNQARVAFCGYDNISERIGLGKNTITKYITILEEELNLITIFNAGRYIIRNGKNQKSIQLPNIYTLNRNGEMKEEFIHWKDDYKKQFPDRKIVNDMTTEEKKFYGIMGSLIKKERNKSITTREVIELDKMRATKNKKLQDRVLTADIKYNQNV